MEVVDQWTGRHACALQLAARLTQDEFAKRLGVARRTVSSWHEKPDMVLSNDFQRVLDTAYDRATELEKIRFARRLRADDAADIEAATGDDAARLTVAIAVVQNEDAVLAVCRRDAEPSGITWQFPAGVVKPGGIPKTVAVRETLAETGVHCAVRRELGSRVHPLSGVFCEYFLCDYLAGDVQNRDMEENVDALWVPRQNLTRFIPADRIFPPVLQILEGAS